MFCGHDSEWANPDCKSDRANLLEGASLSTWNVRSVHRSAFFFEPFHFLSRYREQQVQKVTSLEGTFLNNRKVNFDFSNWQTRSLENLNQAFEGAYVVFECGSSRI